jgi:hypothetical protein
MRKAENFIADRIVFQPMIFLKHPSRYLPRHDNHPKNWNLIDFHVAKNPFADFSADDFFIVPNEFV